MKPPGFWYHAPVSLSGRLIQAVLTPLGHVNGAITANRQKQDGLQVKPKVICVGNLTLGGTGKTPVTAALIEAFKARGLNVQGLTRGYGGKLKGPICVDLSRHTAIDVGDEPLLLARHGPIWVSRDRAEGAKAAELHEAEILIMDDGHQNPALEKDFSIIVIDAEAGWGNGRIFPAGPLRESVSRGLARADAIILMTPDENFQPDYDALGLGELELPIHRAWLEAKSGPPEGKLLAFAGIGRPEKFFNALSKAGAELAATRSFADHHAYTDKDLRTLRNEASQLRARLVTTEKDFVRLPALERDNILFWPVEARFADSGALQTLLDRALERSAARGKPRP